MGRCCAPSGDPSSSDCWPSGRLGHSSPALCFLPLPSPCLPSLAYATVAGHSPTRGSGSWAQRELAVVPLHTLPSAASTEGQRGPFLAGRAREPTGSHRFIWQEAYVQGVAVSAGRQLRSRLGNPNGSRRPLFTGQLAVEAGQGDGEGLQGTQRVVVIHGEHVLCHTAKLHHNVVRWNQAQA